MHLGPALAQGQTHRRRWRACACKGVRVTTLLLLHGLGATGSAWAPLLDVLTWDGPVLVPDLPGHGRAERLDGYSVQQVAAALLPLVPSGPVVVLGHSFGGAVGIALADPAYDVKVLSVAGVGIKASWSGDDVDRFAALAVRPPRTFATRDEALDRHLAGAGLKGQPPLQHLGGVAEAVDGWQLAVDPRAFAQSSPDLAGLVERAGCPVWLLRGELDPMVSRDDLIGCAGAPAEVVELPGLGHNAHVEDPSALWQAARPLLI